MNNVTSAFVLTGACRINVYSAYFGDGIYIVACTPRSEINLVENFINVKCCDNSDSDWDCISRLLKSIYTCTYEAKYTVLDIYNFKW